MKKRTFWQKVISLVMAAVIAVEGLMISASAATLAAPASVTASGITDSSMTLKWSKVSGADAYRVYLWNYDTKAWDSKAYTKSTSAKITGLKADTVCKFRVASYDSVNGKYLKQSTTKTYSFRTGKGKLPGPTNVRATSVKSKSTRLAWQAVDGAGAYLIWYRKSGTKDWLPVRNEKNAYNYTTETSQSVPNLKPGTLYEYCVKTYRIVNKKYVAQGTSEKYTVKTATNDSVMPAHPNITTRARANRIDIFWSNFNTRPGHSSAYALIERWNEQSNSWETVKDQYSKPQVYEGNYTSFYDLKPGNTYKFRLITLDNKYYYNLHDTSDVITVKTPRYASGVWDGTVDTSWYTGDKESYNITNAAQLAGVAKLVNSGNSLSGVTLNLKKDIRLNDVSDIDNWLSYSPANYWEPIGGPLNNKVFSGMFNGNGHTISGMYINSNSVAGLFGYAGGAVITNVKIKDAVINRWGSCNEPAGGLVGQCQNCFVVACEVDGLTIDCWSYPIAREISVGGLIGESGKINYSAYVTYIALMGMGVFINPVVLADMKNNTNDGTYIDSCKVNNVSIKMDNANIGGIIGGGEAMFVYNCLITNVTINSGCESGAIVSYGTGETKNCYSYNYCLTGSNKRQHDKEVVTALTKNELTSASLAKKLGEYFAYSKGNAPVLVVKTAPVAEKEDLFKSGQQYVIKSKLSGLYLDIKNTSKDNGALLIQREYNGGASQKWYFEKQDNGYYLIKNCNSDKYLDVYNYSTEEGGIIIQFRYKGGMNQEWKITEVNGYYKIISRNSGMCLDLLKGNPDSGASVVQWTYSGSDNQLWSIEPV